MARKDSTKPMMPLAPAFAPCASLGCRFPGRLWIRTLPYDKRLCVNHYYRAIEADSSLASDDTVPPKTGMARPVAGPE